MIQINLLSWREQKRKQETKQFLNVLMVCAVLAIGMIVLIYSHASKQVNNQIMRNAMLQNEIFKMTQQINEAQKLQNSKKMLMTRISILQHMRSKRILIVHLLDELINVISSGAYLTHVKGRNQRISLIGYAQSNTDISRLMNNIKRNDWFYAPRLKEIKKRATPAMDYEFELIVTLASSFPIEKIE